MAMKMFAPFFLAGAAAAAIVLAPTAGAASSADCDDDGPAAVCTRNGHASIYTAPRQGGQQIAIAPGLGNPFGYGTMPPLFALD